MFAARFFGRHYYGESYFGGTGAESALVVLPISTTVTITAGMAAVQIDVGSASVTTRSAG